MDFNTMSHEELAAALADTAEKAKALFALDAPTVEQADEAEALAQTKFAIEQVQAERAAAVKAAEEKFAAARAAFSAEDEAEADADETEDADEADEAEAEAVEAAVEDEADADETEDADEADEAEAVEAGIDHSKTQTINGKRPVKTSTAKRVAKGNKRPAVAASAPVIITAAADVPEFATGSVIEGMDKVTKALTNRVKGFPKFNMQSAKAVHSQSGGEEVLSKHGVASFGLTFDSALTAAGNPNSDYAAVQRALKAEGRFDETGVMTAAGWCAPSENVYSYIADYVVDGLVTVPEVSAPRGGLWLTTGPAKDSQGDALDDFGFVQTEAQAEAQTVKTCETIVCPDFTEHRLDAIGYCYKIPLLTQKAYPELITDALRYAGVLYAHKVNRRIINDIVALSDTVSFSGYGPSVTDSLEVLSLIALRERRKWDIGENAVMEVKLPLLAREVFRADMSRRTGLALSDVATDQKIAAEFAARRLAVEYVSDWQELPRTGNIVLPGAFTALIYPKGTFVKAVEDVINLSAVYDAASLSINEYTGVFFEQGIMVAKAAYGSSKVSIPINTAGETGAAILSGLGDSHANGSF